MKYTLRSIYNVIFSSFLTQIWGQICLTHLQNKAITIINFASYRSDVDPLYKTLKILKLCDNSKLQNLSCINVSINGNLPSTLTLTKIAHKHNTCGSAQHQMVIPKEHKIPIGTNMDFHRKYISS